jgi:hypothetical protein
MGRILAFKRADAPGIHVPVSFLNRENRIRALVAKIVQCDGQAECRGVIEQLRSALREYDQQLQIALGYTT